MRAIVDAAPSGARFSNAPSAPRALGQAGRIGTFLLPARAATCDGACETGSA